MQSKYSAGQKKRYKYYFMKQKCQLQMGLAQYKNVAMHWGIEQGLLYTGHELNFWPIQLVGNVGKEKSIDLTFLMAFKASKLVFIAKKY